MEANSDDTVTRAVAHFLAASRLRQKLREDPSLTGLEACARVHIAKVAALASEFCGGAELEAQAPVAMPATIAW